MATTLGVSNLGPQQGLVLEVNVAELDLARESYGRTQFTVELFQPGSALA